MFVSRQKFISGHPFLMRWKCTQTCKSFKHIVGVIVF